MAAEIRGGEGPHSGTVQDRQRRLCMAAERSAVDHPLLQKPKAAWQAEGCEMTHKQAAVWKSQLIQKAKRPRDWHPEAVIACSCAKARFFAGTALATAYCSRSWDDIGTLGRFSTAS